MANEQNLIPVRTESEAREKGRKGGIASGEARRAKKTMAQLAELMLNSKLSEDKKEEIQSQFGDIIDEDATVASMMVAGQIKSAIGGNTKAFNALTELSDKAKASNKADKYELPARVLGKAFVDINRQIKPNIEYVFEGGRGGLKSSFVGFKIIELIKNNPMMHACITRQVAGTLKDSVYAQMKWCINMLGLNDEFECTKSPLEIKYKKTGQIIYFRGLDDETKLKSIKPEFGYIGILWKEEKDQMKGDAQERSVNQSVLRGGNDSYDFSSYNPPKSKSSWVHRIKLQPNPKRVIHQSNYTEAPPEWLGEKFISDAEHLKEVNPEAYEHEYMGVPNGDGGNVFEYLEIRTITDEEIIHMDKIWQGCDFGWYPDIYAFKRLYVDEARKKIYHIAEITGNKLSNSQTAQMIIDAGYDDYTITCDSAEPKSINDYRDNGLPARGAVKGPGSVEYGMKFLQGYTHVIDPERTPVTYKEYTEYEYERDKEGNVISGYPDKNNHTIDADRYALESHYNKRGTSA